VRTGSNQVVKFRKLEKKYFSILPGSLVHTLELLLREHFSWIDAEVEVEAH
jgi:hypothetical protein